MTLLADGHWKLKYTREDGDLVRLFYVPVLEDAVRYDRLTGYFNAQALALAARGIEGLIRNDGRMRLIVGCTLEPAELAAIERGEELKALVEKRLATVSLDPPNAETGEALELLAWLIARGTLEVRVAVPCDERRRPITDEGIFHEKTGIVEDRVGDRLAWTGSLNETAAGWLRNWETINVYRAWAGDAERVDLEEASFAQLWANRSTKAITLDVPRAVRENLLRFLPRTDQPRRLSGGRPETHLPIEGKPEAAPLGTTQAAQRSPEELRRLVWTYVWTAASRPNGGERVGEATSAVTPWPHQVRAFQRLYEHWPPKLLIADEVGLGKTIQAGLLLRQAWFAGRAKRILVLAPKAVLRQWQLELREKFNLHWPIYDGQKLVWCPTPSDPQGRERAVTRETWHREPFVLVSSHLMRRQGRAAELLELAEPWDLIVLDEAHHARRRAAGAAKEGGPNALLALMQRLKERTQGLLLLTATPMQVHPIELWDLLNLLGLPDAWTPQAFLRFFEDVSQPNPSHEALDRMAALFQAVEAHYGLTSVEAVVSLTGLSRLRARKLLLALRDKASIPRRQLETAERAAALRVLKANTPVARLVSRHTRELLRRYHRAGMLTTPIAERQVEDRFITMSPEERALYEAVEAYISTTYNKAAEEERNAVGFVMTIYRRRLASSFRALACTLKAHLDALAGDDGERLLTLAEEDVADESLEDEPLEAEEAVERERHALAGAERQEIETILRRIAELPPDTKVEQMLAELDVLRAQGYRQVIVFTQYTDTMEFIREQLVTRTSLRVLCFSGRGGEVYSGEGRWRIIGREDAKRRFRDQQADVLVCTDAAAEGLNFQFCGALINYDMPWNPMRVEQRIGRIDRLGQAYSQIRISNLHYEHTVETDVYMALRDRIGLFQAVVGRLQPILSTLPRTLSETVLSGGATNEAERARVAARIVQEAERASGFDLDEVTEADLTPPARPDPALTFDALDRIIRNPALLPPGCSAEPLAPREYAWSMPGLARPVRVTTNPEFYEANSDCVELWSPGAGLFPAGPESLAELPEIGSIEDLL